jgi:hypothetical protein
MITNDAAILSDRRKLIGLQLWAEAPTNAVCHLRLL